MGRKGRGESGFPFSSPHVRVGISLTTPKMSGGRSEILTSPLKYANKH